MLFCLIDFSLLAIAEETLSEFLSKATGTSVEWVQMGGMKVTTELNLLLMIAMQFKILYGIVISFLCLVIC